MNGRLYACPDKVGNPLVARMLSPDPYIMGEQNTQGYNRYSYGLNNPLKYTDPSGKIVWFVPVIFAAVNVAVGLAINKGKMNFGQIVMSAGLGALSGFIGGAGITSAGSALLSASIGQVNKFLPAIPIYQSQNFNIIVSPMIGFGSSGFNFGGSINASGQCGDFVWNASVSGGYNSGMSSLGDPTGSSWHYGGGAFAGYTDGHANYGFGVFSSQYTGNTAQRVGGFQAQIGDFGFRMDEDFFPIVSDGGDRYRTGAVLMTYKLNNDFTLAFGGSMMTGDPKSTWDFHPEGNPNLNKNNMYNNCSENLYNLRGGIMYGGVIYKGQSYFRGNNSEKRLRDIQRWIHREVTKTSPYFEN